MVDASARKKLRDNIRRLWDTDPDFIKLQDELRKAGRETIAPLYKKCLEESGEPVSKCYHEAAKAARLYDVYRRIWGAPTSG